MNKDVCRTESTSFNPQDVKDNFLGALASLSGTLSPYKEKGSGVEVS